MQLNSVIDGFGTQLPPPVTLGVKKALLSGARTHVWGPVWVHARSAIAQDVPEQVYSLGPEHWESGPYHHSKLSLDVLKLVGESGIHWYGMAVGSTNHLDFVAS